MFVHIKTFLRLDLLSVLHSGCTPVHSVIDLALDCPVGCSRFLAI